MNRKLLRVFCAGLVTVLLLLSLPSCGQVDPMADSGIESILLDEDGVLTVKAVVSVDVLAATEAKTAHLYELLPGETSVQEKTPIASAEVEHKLEFSVPLKDGDRSRLYSSFAVVLEDGTEISTRPFFVENPETLAANRTPFMWIQSPKALYATDVASAFESGAMHVMLEVGLSEIVGADGTFQDMALLKKDKQIAEATRSGMQVSLLLRLDQSLPTQTLVALFSELTARYNGGERGCVSALFLKMGSGYEDATVCRFANLALRSQVANGRVYMISSGKTVDEVKAEYTNLYRVLSESGSIAWGAALVPDDSGPAWEKGEDGVVSPDQFNQISDFLMTSDSVAHADWFAVCGADYRTLDEEQQAVSYAYLYRAALEAGAGLVFWDAQFDDDCGLYTKDGEERPLASVFESIDRGLNEDDLALCQALAGNAWDRLRGNFTSRESVSGLANFGTSGLEEDMLFDFSDSDVHGFFSVASPADVKTQNSAAFQKPVLYSWVDPNSTANSGVRRFFDNAQAFQNVTTLSLRLLTQAPKVQECRIVLSLEGQREGGERVSYESAITLSNNSWQTVTFQISSFTTGLDASAPCVLTLTAQPCRTEEGEISDQPFVLWVRDLYVRYPSDGSATVILTVAVILVVLLVAGVLLLFYGRSVHRKDRKKKAAQNRQRRKSEDG